MKFLFLHPSLKKIRGLGPAGILALIWLSAPGIAGIYLLYQLGPVSKWLESLGPVGLVVYSLTFLFTSGLGILPTTAQAVLGGWVFGPVKGLIAASVAFAGAAVIGLWITRAVAGRRVQSILETKPEAVAIRDALIGGGFWRKVLMITLLRLPPQSPFAFTNFLLISCGAPTGPFILGTIFGLIPRTALVMALSHAASLTGASDIQSFVKEGPGWPVAVLGIVIVMIVMAIIGFIARKALIKLHVDPAVLKP